MYVHTHIHEREIWTDRLNVFLPHRVIINYTIPHYTFYATALLVTNTLNVVLSYSLRLRSLVKKTISPRDGSIYCLFCVILCIVIV
jgi:hypothetical protein